MYGDILYGWLYSSSSLPVGVVTEDISFENYGLQNANIIVEYFNPIDSGDIEYNTFNIPQGHGKGFLSRFWREKTIAIKWIIKCDSAILLQSKIDEIKKAIRKSEGILKYKLADSSYRQINTTCTSMKFDKQSYNITWIPFELQFKANEPFWYNTSISQKFYSGVTTSPFLEEITNDGNEESRLQTFFFFWATSGTTSISITLNNRTVTWTGTIATWDLLYIDCLSKQVLKNGSTQDYSGTFPILLPGVNSITYTINGTFTCDISNIFRLNYL